MVTRSTEKDKLFGAKIKSERLAVKKSRREVAEKINMSQQQFQKYETAENRISAGKLVEIAKAIDVPLLDVIPEEFLELDNVDNLAIFLWKKLSYQNKKAAISVMREMVN